MNIERFTQFAGRGFAARVVFTVTASIGLLNAAGNANLISLGNSASPVLSALKDHRQMVDGRALLQSIRQSHIGANTANAVATERRALAARMSQTEAVVMDLAESTPTEDDLAVIEAARVSAIPVVLENVDKEKMAAIFGVGLDTSLVVADYDASRHMGRLSFGEPAQLTGVEEDPMAMGELRSFQHKVDVAEAAITRGHEVLAKGLTAMVTMNSYGSCSQTALTNTQCQEWYSVGLGPVKFFGYYYNGQVSIIYPFAYSFVDPEFVAGIYQVGATKYVRLRATGGWGNTGVITGSQPVFTSDAHDRFPFFGNYSIAMLPTNMPSDWAIDNAAPNNPNNQGQISQTTGWQVGVTASNPPSATASYGSTTTTTITDNDWSVTNTSASPNGQWNYYMSSAYDCTGSPQAIAQNQTIPNAIMSYCLSSAQNFINNPPSWSWNGNQYNSSTPLAEVVWKGASSPNLSINYQTSAKVWGIMVQDHWIYYNENWATTTSPTSNNAVTLNTSVVHN